MGRPKGSGKKAVIEAESPVYGNETEETSIAPVIEQEAPKMAETVFSFDTWIYSENEPPVILKAGNPMPAGYTRERSEVKAFWACDANGKFTKQ